MSEPIIVNGSKLSEEELKQLLEEIKKSLLLIRGRQDYFC